MSGGGPWTPCPVFSRPPPQTLRPPLVKLTKCVKGSGFARFKKCVKGLSRSYSRYTIWSTAIVIQNACNIASKWQQQARGVQQSFHTTTKQAVGGGATVGEMLIQNVSLLLGTYINHQSENLTFNPISIPIRYKNVKINQFLKMVIQYIVQ